MPRDPDRPAPSGKSGQHQPPTPGWEKQVYSSERIKKFLKGEITLQELHAISTAEMAELAMLGYRFYEQGRYDQSRIIFQGLCALDAKEPYYRTALGAVFLALDNLEMAESVLTVAIQLNPHDIASLVNRGEVYLRQNRIMDAAQDFKKAVELDPQNKDPLSKRARLLAAAVVETIHAAKRESGGSSGTPTPSGKK